MEEAITVEQLNTRVRDLIGKDPGVTDIWVTGEISELKVYSSGHCYFTLKDERSQIQCVMFSGRLRTLSFQPKVNMKVALFGNVDIYVPNGKYQFIVYTMREDGLGDRFKRLEELKKKLRAEGLFDESRKRKLPLYPKTIGVVTSEKGAVIHDIITTASKRFPAEILLAPALVQGEGSVESIVHGIELLNKVGVDIIIVGRGGGSLEDLWSFNEEAVARAIANSKIPVISAVGHESDFTLADSVADVRAPTPTGAAQIALREKVEIFNDLESCQKRIDKALLTQIRHMSDRLDVVSSKLDPRKAEDLVKIHSVHLNDLLSRSNNAMNHRIQKIRQRLEMTEMRLDHVFENRHDDQKRRLAEMEYRLNGIPDRLLVSKKQRFDNLSVGLEHLSEMILISKGSQLDNLSARLDALDPTKVLDRGYSMITDITGNPLTTIDRIEVGSNVTICLKDGVADAKIKEIRK